MSELLKPCPFCGGRLYEELKDAIEAWNRRVKHEES